MTQNTQIDLLMCEIQFQMLHVPHILISAEVTRISDIDIKDL